MTKKAELPDNIEVKNSSIHHKGVFATKDIKKGEKIIEYVGEKITKAESDKRATKVLEKSKGSKTLGAVYIFEVNKRFDIDGNVDWNPARFINHSCEPNCEAVNEEGHIWIFAKRNIKAGDELFYNYGYSFDDVEEHRCLCNSPKCVGYILDEDYWPKLKKKIKEGKIPKPVWSARYKK